jgi:multiple sugar transport system permease protein
VQRAFNKLNTGAAPPEEVIPAAAAAVRDALEEELADWEAQAALEDPPGRRISPVAGTALILGGLLAGALLFFAATRRGRKTLATRRDEIRAMFRSPMSRGEAFAGLAFAAPWIIGFLIFTLFPILFSIVLSFSEWDPYTPIEQRSFVGFRNYLTALFHDPLLWKALWNTMVYAFWSVPASLALSLALALLLNQKIRGITIFRTVFYVPSIVGGVATTIMWLYLFNPYFGPINTALGSLDAFFEWTRVLAWVDVPQPGWFGDPAYAKPALVIMALWGSGGAGMLIFLAGLQGVPDQLYEVAELDGAGRWRKFLNVTLPMLTPTIYFNFVMGVINAWQVFMQAYVLTGGKGGTDDSLLFYVLYLFQKAFVEYEMGYASAMAWILFVIIFAFTLLVIRSSAIWVYYEGERKG